MKPTLIKTIMQRTIGASRRVGVPLTRSDALVVLTEATLPFWMPAITKHLKRGDYIAVSTPGNCHHCHKYDDLRFGVCMRCVDYTYTDGVFCWHTTTPDEQWAIPKLDHVLRRIRFELS